MTVSLTFMTSVCPYLWFVEFVAWVCLHHCTNNLWWSGLSSCTQNTFCCWNFASVPSQAGFWRLSLLNFSVVRRCRKQVRRDWPIMLSPLSLATPATRVSSMTCFRKRFKLNLHKKQPRFAPRFILISAPRFILITAPTIRSAFYPYPIFGILLSV